MKRLFVLLAMVIFLTAGGIGSVQAEPKTAQGIRDYCASEWPTNYTMQRYCIDEQGKACNEMVALYMSLTEDEEKRIVNRCLLDWGYESGFEDLINWSMVAYCTKEQLKAYRNLHK